MTERANDQPVVEPGDRLVGPLERPAVHPELDSLSAEFASISNAKIEANCESTHRLNYILEELVNVAREYRTSVVPGGSEVHFGHLAMANNELELIVSNTD